MQTLETPLGNAILKRTNRRTLAISVLPDGRLELTAPMEAPEAAILAKVSKRARWIGRQRETFTEMNATRAPRRFVSGATHRYLGKQYRIKVTVGAVSSVRLKGGYFCVVTSTGAPDEIERCLDTWFRDKARTQLQRRLATWETWCHRHQLPHPHLVLRRMPKRWGSACYNGRIALTPELIHVSSACIDYVIAHEICHLKHPSHGPRFFRLLSSVMPDWRNRKERLERTELT